MWEKKQTIYYPVNPIHCHLLCCKSFMDPKFSETNGRETDHLKGQFCEEVMNNNMYLKCRGLKWGHL